MCACDCSGNPATTRRFRPLGFMFQVLAVYLLLVLGGGALLRTGHPVAIETGRLIHTVTFVQPTIHWAESRGFEGLAGGLRLVAGDAALAN
jgi:hypothetical protein